MGQSGMTRAPEKEDAVPAGQQERQDGGSPDSKPRGAPWRRRRGQEQPAPPWRVEGMPDDKQEQQDDHRNWPRFWLILLGLLIINRSCRRRCSVRRARRCPTHTSWAS